MEGKTMERLSDVKRYLKVGATVRCTFGPKAGKLRKVVKVQSNGILVIDPETAEPGRGSRLDFQKRRPRKVKPGSPAWFGCFWKSTKQGLKFISLAAGI